MRILLAYISGLPDRSDPYISLLPSGLCSLHACLRQAGFDAVLANYSGWSNDEIRRHVAAMRPELTGISQWTHNRHASLELAQLLRHEQPDCTIVMGGAHATCCYADILRSERSVDCIILGEAEETLLELAGRIDCGNSWTDIRGIAYLADGGITVTPRRQPLGNLDLLPSATSCLDYSVGIDIPLQAEFILTARGCPSGCYFCSSPNIWQRKVRFRSPENIVDEMMLIRNRYGLIYFSLRDDTFTADRGRTIEICRLLIEKRAGLLWNCQSRVNAIDEELLAWMKRAGCECIQLGVESGSPRILKLLGKTITPRQAEQAAALIRKTGINLSIYLISDIPGETDDDIRQTVETVRRIRPDDGYVSPLAYYPGTRLFDEAVAAGKIGADVFMTDRQPAVYAAGKPGSTTRTLLRAIAGSAPHGQKQHFSRQKELLGFCYVTNILAGEYFRQAGDPAAAEREFREITDREPDNPWGWYLLAELYSETGERDSAMACYRRVNAIVPRHGPTLQALATKKKRGR